MALADVLPESVRSRQIECRNLSVHILECGDPKQQKMILLLHGFPELAFSWRKLLPLLSDAGYYVVAPDMRGYGQTVTLGSDLPANSIVKYQDGLEGFGMVETCSEMVALVSIINSQRGFPNEIECVVGHDMGSAVAANLALLRPDIFRRLTMMSAPFTGPPSVPGTQDDTTKAKLEVIKALGSLQPPRKHYQRYFCEPEANEDWMHSKQGLRELYRGYYYFKSNLHPENKPRHLGEVWQTEAIQSLPEYYIMRKSLSMSETVSNHVPNMTQMTKEMPWMTERELAVYVEAFERTGFQGGLNHYRARVSGYDSERLGFTIGESISVPTLFISGAGDWGTYQDPGGLERMESRSVVQEGLFHGIELIDGAGHWVQQERPKETASVILAFLVR